MNWKLTLNKVILEKTNSAPPFLVTCFAKLLWKPTNTRTNTKRPQRERSKCNRCYCKIHQSFVRFNFVMDAVQVTPVFKDPNELMVRNSKGFKHKFTHILNINFRKENQLFYFVHQFGKSIESDLPCKFSVLIIGQTMISLKTNRIQ